MTKKEDEVEAQELAQEAEDQATTESVDESTTASSSDNTHLDSEAPEDILNIERDDLPQDAPDSDGETKERVV